jgi:hypothetical protein
MDNALDLTQACLRVNGCFTVTEYPVLGAMNRRGYQVLAEVSTKALGRAPAWPVQTFAPGILDDAGNGPGDRPSSVR